MLRGFLKELGNVALNRATNKINAQINKQLGSGVGLPTSRRGGVDQSAYAKLNNRFRGEAIAYPEDLGSIDQGHYVHVHNVLGQYYLNLLGMQSPHP